jgi:hypothetical protein
VKLKKGLGLIDMADKVFIGFDKKDDALLYFGSILLDPRWSRREKKIKVVDDGRRWPQYSSKTITVVTIETDKCIVSFEDTIQHHDPILV